MESQTNEAVRWMFVSLAVLLVAATLTVFQGIPTG